MGQTATADPDLIPDFSDCCDPKVAWFTGALYCRGNYQLLVDNLLDLTHTEFLHPFLSSEGFSERNVQTVTQENGVVTVSNIALEDNIIPVMKALKPHVGHVGTTTSVERWHAPGLISLSVIYTSGEDEISIPSAHMLTPETETTTHYFVRGGQTVDPSNDEMTQANRIGVLAVFQNEDIPMIEDQQKHIGKSDLLQYQPVIMRSDKGAMLARSHMARLLREEAAKTEIAAAE